MYLIFLFPFFGYYFETTSHSAKLIVILMEIRIVRNWHSQRFWPSLPWRSTGRV